MKMLVIKFGRSVSVLAILLAVIPLFEHAQAAASYALPTKPGIWLSRDPRRKLSDAHTMELVQSLQRITGFRQLGFTENGLLMNESPCSSAEGAVEARQVLERARQSGHVFIIEDYSGSDEVHFGQLDEGTNYEDTRTGIRLLIWRVRLDFADFHEMEAAQDVRASFDCGFTALHELLHGLGHTDSLQEDSIGEIEEILNRARTELQLPLRDSYFGELVPISTRMVSMRLRFLPQPSTQAAQAAQSARALGSAPPLKRKAKYLFFLLPHRYRPLLTVSGLVRIGCGPQR